MYNAADRSWVETRLSNEELQGLANGMRAQQLFWFHGSMYYRTEGYDIYQVEATPMDQRSIVGAVTNAMRGG